MRRGGDDDSDWCWTRSQVSTGYPKGQVKQMISQVRANQQVWLEFTTQVDMLVEVTLQVERRQVRGLPWLQVTTGREDRCDEVSNGYR